MQSFAKTYFNLAKSIKFNKNFVKSIKSNLVAIAYSSGIFRDLVYELGIINRSLHALLAPQISWLQQRTRFSTVEDYDDNIKTKNYHNFILFSKGKKERREFVKLYKYCSKKKIVFFLVYTVL